MTAAAQTTTQRTVGQEIRLTKGNLLILASLLLVTAAAFWQFSPKELQREDIKSTGYTETTAKLSATTQTGIADSGGSPDIDSLNRLEAEFSQSEVPDIFVEVSETELNAGVLAQFMEYHAIERHRIVKVDADVLRSQIWDVADSEIVLNLLDDYEVIAISHNKRELTSGPATGLANWAGTVKGQEDVSYVVRRCYDSINTWFVASIGRCSRPRHTASLVRRGLPRIWSGQLSS